MALNTVVNPALPAVVPVNAGAATLWKILAIKAELKIYCGVLPVIVLDDR
jgi:hypothetical protein